MYSYLGTVCTLSKESWPILYSKLLYKLGQNFLYIQYLYKITLDLTLNLNMIDWVIIVIY